MRQAVQDLVHALVTEIATRAIPGGTGRPTTRVDRLVSGEHVANASVIRRLERTLNDMLLRGDGW